MIENLSPKEKKKLQKLLDKMDYEGGLYEYVMSYSSAEDVVKEHPYLPTKLKDSLIEMAKYARIAEECLETVRDEMEGLEEDDENEDDEE